MKLQDKPQPKVFYNRQSENKIAIINKAAFAEILVILLEITETHTANWVLL